MPKLKKLKLNDLTVNSFETTKGNLLKGGDQSDNCGSDICNTNNGNCDPGPTWMGCQDTYGCNPMQTVVDCADHIK